MSNAKRIVDYIRSETEFSGIRSYPVAIEDIAAELSLPVDSVQAELKLLRNQGIIEFCAIGNSSARFTTR